MSNENEFIVLKRECLDEQDHHTWQTMDLNVPLTSDKPILLVLGGNGTQDTHSTKGNGNIVATSLGVFKQDVDMFCINYNHNDFFTAQMAQLVKWVFTNKLSKGDKKLDTDLACKNMSSVRAVSHCYGSGPIIQEMVYQLTVMMDDLNYDDNEQLKILKQFFSLNFAFHQRVNFISGLDIFSINDSVFVQQGIDLTKKFLNNINELIMNTKDYNNFRKNDFMESYEFIKNSDRCYVVPDGNRISLIGSNFTNTVDDHPIVSLKRGDNWEKIDITTPTGETVSKCFSCALCNAVANSILNLQSNKHVPFDIDYLREQLELICAKTNEIEPIEPSI